MERERIILAAALMFAAGNAAAQPAAGTVKTAGETLKNVRVLTDVPVKQWNDTMWFMSTSLGVFCDHCHTGRAYESDDRKAKLTARNMIQMTRGLNAQNFGGRTRITCYTCHQGSLQPKAASALWNKTPEETAALRKEQQEKQAAPAAPKQEPLPDADVVIANYRRAVGGDRVKTIYLKATVDTNNRGSITGEIDIEMPDRLAQRFTIGGAKILQVIDRDHGWSAAPDRTVEMLPENIDSAKEQIVALCPVKIREAEAPRKTTAFETIDGRTFVVVESHGARHLARLYFDRQSGLLYKEAGETHTPLGDYPYETVYEDYRDVDGVKMPFRAISRDPENSTRYNFSEIRLNKPIDPSRFERPQAAAGK